MFISGGTLYPDTLSRHHPPALHCEQLLHRTCRIIRHPPKLLLVDPLGHLDQSLFRPHRPACSKAGPWRSAYPLWGWFLLSLGFFLGVVLLALPVPQLVTLGADIITALRVMIECLLLILVTTIAFREHIYALSPVGLLLILPVGCSILLRHVAAPLITTA